MHNFQPKDQHLSSVLTVLSRVFLHGRANSEQRHSSKMRFVGPKTKVMSGPEWMHSSKGQLLSTRVLFGNPIAIYNKPNCFKMVSEKNCFFYLLSQTISQIFSSHHVWSDKRWRPVKDIEGVPYVHAGDGAARRLPVKLCWRKIFDFQANLPPTSGKVRLFCKQMKHSKSAEANSRLGDPRASPSFSGSDQLPLRSFNKSSPWKKNTPPRKAFQGVDLPIFIITFSGVECSSGDLKTS